ncbi:MAG: hypothetical protein IJH39_11320 [Clostridia bacterium]|nr:hypothetical protein [Clostridia bacterium]
MDVRVIDTSVLLNILDIPNRNANHEEVFKEFKELAESKNETLILPLASIIETGNHIAHISDGNIRREKAKLFSIYLKKTANGEAPWEYFGKELDKDDLSIIADEFPSNAMMETGIGDMSIIRAYEKYKQLVPSIGRIMIWSLDGHLQGYSENVAPVIRRRSR